MSSKRKGKGGVRSRIAILLGPAGVRKDDIKWSGREGLVICCPTKEAQVQAIVDQIQNKNRTMKLKVSATKGVPRHVITTAAATASAT